MKKAKQKVEQKVTEETKAETTAIEGSPEPRPTKSSGEFMRVPRRLIRPDPRQPRKEFSEASLQEMAMSIYLQGIIQPLVVKHVAPELKIIEPDMVNGKMWQAVQIDGGAVVFESKDEEAVRRHAGERTNEFYQLIAGERRWRSTEARTLEIDGKEIKWPGLSELPVMVRAADAQDTFALQHMENQARVNLSALEEAQSFGEELTRRQAVDPTMTAEKLGAELGVKKVTAYSRMKLLRLKPAVRAALVAGKIEASHALAIAAVPDVKRQEDLLQEASALDYDGERMSIRALQELIDDEYVKQLKDAPFDRNDEKLVPVSWLLTAGENELILNCTKQPRFVDPRTIGIPIVTTGTFNNPGIFVTTNDKFELAGPLLKKEAKNLVEFITANAKARAITVSQASGWACTTCPHRSGVMDPETKTPNVCTLPSCFEAKVKAHWVKKSEELTAKGTPVLTEGALRKLGKHIPEDKHEYTQNKSGTFKELMGKHAPEPVLVATKEGIKKFYPAEDAIAAAKKNGVKFYTSGRSVSPADVAKEKERREKAEELRESREKLVNGLAELVVPAINAMKEAEAWKMVLAEQSEVYHRHGKLIISKAKGDRAKVLAHVLSESLFRSLTDWNTGEWREDTLKLWKQLGVDLVAEEKKRDPAPALPLKAEPKQKTLLDVKQKGPKKSKKK